MSFVQKIKNIVHIKDSAGNCINIDLTDLMSLDNKLAINISAALSNYCSKYNSLGEAKKLRTLLKQFGQFYLKHNSNLSDNKSLYLFLFNFRAHWFTTNLIAQRIDVRNENWDVFKKFIKHIMDLGIIASTVIPPSNPKLYNKDILARTELSRKGRIGDDNNECITSLVPISLARSDEQYLDELEIQFNTARDVFLKCALNEIDEIESAMLVGDELINKVDYSKLTSLIEASFLNKKPYKMALNELNSLKSIELVKHGDNKYVCLFGPKNPTGYFDILARIKNEHNGYYCCYMNSVFNNSDPALNNLARTIPSQKILGSHLGLLTCRNAVPFFIYLLLKNPKFNVESLAKIELSGENGVTRFLATAGENQSKVRMKVKKGRANVEKSEILDDDSKKVLRILLRLTNPLRDYLKKQGDPNFNKLWICGGSAGTEYPYKLSVEMIRKHFGQQASRIDCHKLNPGDKSIAKRSFLASHTELKQYINIATLSKLRTTSGLITWFETGGDALATSHKFGNTINVCLDHYIPKPLQILMNMRTIRKFQNLLIVAATCDENIMLEATDFKDLDELHCFLSQMLNNNSNSGSELINYINTKLNGIKDISDIKDNIINEVDKKITIKVTTDNLAVLFLYQEHVDNNLLYESKLIKDKVTNTTPYFWSDFSKKISLAIKTDPTLRNLTHVYEQALDKMEGLRTFVDFPEIAIHKSLGAHVLD